MVFHDALFDCLSIHVERLFVLVMIIIENKVDVVPIFLFLNAHEQTDHQSSAGVAVSLGPVPCLFPDRHAFQYL
jgi:hypothetical protein